MATNKSNSEGLLYDEQLFLAISEGSHEAFHKFFYSYEKRVYGFLYKMLLSHEEAEELLQIVFVKIWENRATKNLDCSLEAYVFAIAKNCVLDALRQRVRKFLFEKQLIENFKESEDGEAALIDEDLKRHIASLIAHIPERRREIFKLRYEKELSYKEIAEQLNISENTVDTQIRHARNCDHFRGEPLERTGRHFLHTLGANPARGGTAGIRHHRLVVGRQYFHVVER